ncbi:unnamed protein product [Nezara viridula]|uniref:Cadherin domain-containing protein n=1 Tax=Nezara viridula TaxID=85310 RepID=A0A9P0H7B6_NEZVI|nr:unnamed protein product [Nezara viridula]
MVPWSVHCDAARSVSRLRANRQLFAGCLRCRNTPPHPLHNIQPPRSKSIIYIYGVLTTVEPLDRETKSNYDLVAEARDGGVPPRTTRVPLKIYVTDVNDNAPEILDPREDVVSIREEQPPGTEVVKIRAVDKDNGPNATLTYSILKGRDADGWRVFSIDPVTGILRTRVPLEAGEREVYRVRVAATDTGNPPRQSVRTLSVEVLALYDHRPTFSSSSLTFKKVPTLPTQHLNLNVERTCFLHLRVTAIVQAGSGGYRTEAVGQLTSIHLITASGYPPYQDPQGRGISLFIGLWRGPAVVHFQCIWDSSVLWP